MMFAPHCRSALVLLLGIGLLGFTSSMSTRWETFTGHQEAGFIVSADSQAVQPSRLEGQRFATQTPIVPIGQSNTISVALLPMVQSIFFEQTKHQLSDRAGFLSFWRGRGGILVFGYPISEEIVEDGRIVQYFERARFEYHPEHLEQAGQVQLSLLGRELTTDRVFPAGIADPDVRYFPETGHTLSKKFLKFWLKRGGLDIFGYPISEPIEETSWIDGKTRLTQYFERARLEYHAEEMDSFYRNMEQERGLMLATLHEIQISDVGSEFARRKGYTFTHNLQLPGIPIWSPNLWARRIDVNLSTQQLTVYEDTIAVYRAPIASGKDGFNTPTGSFAIYYKLPITTMDGAAGGEHWYVPNIPWVQYVVGGVALHGTYWHDQWGTGMRLSHGCINLNMDDAEWLYDWTGIGTQVDIHY